MTVYINNRVRRVCGRMEYRIRSPVGFDTERISWEKLRMDLIRCPFDPSEPNRLPN